MATDGMLYVLAPVHDRRATTEGFLQCLKAQTDRNFHLVLIDDGSRDGTADAARATGLPLTVLSGTGDWWWGGSLQQGYLWLKERPRTGGEVVLIMNDDTRFDPDFLAAGRAALARHPGALLLAQAYDAHSGAFLDAGVRADWDRLQFLPASDPAQVDCMSTRGLFLRLEDFLALGGFHPHLLPHYGSDFEFTLRAHRRGHALVSDPSVRLRSDQSTTGDRDPDAASSLGDYLRRRFSKRSVLNPWYWTTFILLSCPPAKVLPNLWRVWWDFLVRAKKAVTR
jgi:GT2 family glycosyltransferase